MRHTVLFIINFTGRKTEGGVGGSGKRTFLKMENKFEMYLRGDLKMKNRCR